jgi:ferric-dicitrate binding protein FerR (iron transport regulator)
VKLQSGNRPDVLMEPGELAELNLKAGKLVKKVVDTKIYNSWINKQLIFDNTPLHEVAATLEDNYGLKIEFGEGIAQERFTGTIPTDNVDIFFTILSESLDISITKNNNLIKVNYKNLN